MISRFFVLVLLFGGIYPTLGLSNSQDKKVDLSGFYDSGTLTPLSRPQQFGDKQFMTRQEADEITRNMRGLLATSNSKSDPNRSAPKLGGDGNNSPEFCVLCLQQRWDGIMAVEAGPRSF